MKKLRILLAFVCLIGLLLPGLRAQAESASPAERGLEALQTARNFKCIVLPKEESYLEAWKTLYARRAWYAPSLYVESLPQLQSGIAPQPMLYEGTQVTVVAEENDMSCILYGGRNNKRYAGWIQSIRLQEDFPGEQLLIGQARDGSFEMPGEVPLSWSGEYFPDTQQPFTRLEEPVRDCVGFTFEYQVVSRNTPNTDIILGPRTLYVYDGEAWTEVGSFPYPELGAVKVQVWLEKPADIAAIATVADCHAPNMFDFRQTARDFLCLPPDDDVQN